MFSYPGDPEAQEGLEKDNVLVSKWGNLKISKLMTSQLIMYNAAC